MLKAIRPALAGLSAALLAGCAWFGGGAAPQPTVQHEFKPVSTALNGEYRLASASGEPLPSLRNTQNGCRVELDSATLTIYGRRFDLTSTTRRYCGDSIVTSTLHHVSGSYVKKGQHLNFKVDQGGYFDSAKGMLVGHEVRLVSLNRLSSGVEPVDWLFHLHSRQTKPSPLKAN